MERISFTRPSAARIARVVRIVENARPGGRPLETQRQDTLAKASVFRLCTYTGAWSIGSSKAVTFKNRTSTPNTVSATNLFFPITSTAAGNRDCAIAKDGTAWYLIDVRLSTATAIFVTSTAEKTFVSATASGVSLVGVESRNYVSSTATQGVVSDITLSAVLNTSNCSITIGKTLVTSSIAVASGTSAGLFVTSTATAMFASTTATAVFADGTATATYLTFA